MKSQVAQVRVGRCPTRCGTGDAAGRFCFLFVGGFAKANAKLKMWGFLFCYKS
jgi:hypothetical protein